MAFETDMKLIYEKNIDLLTKKVDWTMQSELHKALFYLTALELLEPDDKEIKEIINILTKNSDNKKFNSDLINIHDYTIFIDANAYFDVFNKDCDYDKIPFKKKVLNALSNLKEQNKLVISKSVSNEITDNYLDREDVILKKSFLERAKKFYYKEPAKLYQITFNKLKYKKSVKEKINLLSKREYLMPEKGDILLLQEAFKERKTNSKVAIFTNDSDFTWFKKELKKEFGIVTINV